MKYLLANNMKNHSGSFIQIPPLSLTDSHSHTHSLQAMTCISCHGITSPSWVVLGSHQLQAFKLQINNTKLASHASHAEILTASSDFKVHNKGCFAQFCISDPLLKHPSMKNNDGPLEVFIPVLNSDQATIQALTAHLNG
ncbi:interferon-induced GTP-binding protein Mx1-like [Platysternon megacephalum]|uniref:Interferon-induced GTP-binding protein Mx1-like n=1 Tax=Platysternon megacephalum TaxID=55544 RepID=A0A4D9DZL4_9SAUR|nr:interferon-induced GTP-binding protein Mx1-like [Platysternon megacephalum]